MLPYLFVYGTLKSACAGHFGCSQRERLQRESRLLGAAVMAGRLYDLGRYPGLADAMAPGEEVHGEVVELRDPAAAFQWLDAYEGIFAGAPDASEYHRVQRPAWPLDAAAASLAGTMTAWVYLYAGDWSSARRIEGGRWPA